jgi:hypothetical protein
MMVKQGLSQSSGHGGGGLVPFLGEHLSDSPNSDPSRSGYIIAWNIRFQSGTDGTGADADVNEEGFVSSFFDVVLDDAKARFSLIKHADNRNGHDSPHFS